MPHAGPPATRLKATGKSGAPRAEASRTPHPTPPIRVGSVGLAAALLGRLHRSGAGGVALRVPGGVPTLVADLAPGGEPARVSGLAAALVARPPAGVGTLRAALLDAVGSPGRHTTLVCGLGLRVQLGAA